MKPIRLSWSDTITKGRPCIRCGERAELVTSEPHKKTGNLEVKKSCATCKEIKV